MDQAAGGSSCSAIAANDPDQNKRQKCAAAPSQRAQASLDDPRRKRSTRSSLSTDSSASSPKFQRRLLADSNSTASESEFEDDDDDDIDDPTVSFTYTASDSVASVIARLQSPLHFDLNATSPVTLYMGRTPLDPSKQMGFYQFAPDDGNLDLRLEAGAPPPPLTPKEKFRQQSCSAARVIMNTLSCDDAD